VIRENVTVAGADVQEWPVRQRVRVVEGGDVASGDELSLL
jgi:hypothetical protein